MISESIGQYLGLMQRASKLVTGEELVLKSIKNRVAYLVLISDDMGDSSKKKIVNKCQHYNIKVINVGTKDELSQSIGQNRSVVSIIDQGFAAGFVNKI